MTSLPDNDFGGLLQLVATLRQADGGCPWDLQQTAVSLLPYMEKELHEFADAVSRDEPQNMAAELGDLLFLVALQTQIGTEKEHFSMEQVLSGIISKMVRRHPHVYAGEQIESIEQQRHRWNAIKQAEQQSNQQNSFSATVPTDKPPLLTALQAQQAAAKLGFDWENSSQVLAKVAEELQELADAMQVGDPTAIEEELGDMLFAITNLSRHLQLDSSMALRKATNKFARRLDLVQQLAQRQQSNLANLTAEQLNQLWCEAKLATALQK